MIDRDFLISTLPYLVETEQGRVILVYAFTDKRAGNSSSDYFEGIYLEDSKYSSPRVNIIAENQGSINITNVKPYEGVLTLENETTGE